MRCVSSRVLGALVIAIGLLALVASPAHGTVALEIELPEIDEVVWARAEVARAFLTPLPGKTRDGQPRFWCSAGLRLAGVCQRERRLLRDYVLETRRARRLAAEQLTD